MMKMNQKILPRTVRMEVSGDLRNNKNQPEQTKKQEIYLNHALWGVSLIANSFKTSAFLELKKLNLLDQRNVSFFNKRSGLRGGKKMFNSSSTHRASLQIASWLFALGRPAKASRLRPRIFRMRVFRMACCS